jgi:hypothetical protein
VTIAQFASTAQTRYSSLVSPLPANVVSQSFEATGTSELRNQITLDVYNVGRAMPSARF